MAYFDGPLFTGATASFSRRSLVVANADGSAPIILTGPIYGQQARWSPDGGSLAYTEYEAAGDYLSRRVMVVGIDGAPPRQLVTTTDGSRSAEFDPSWSPDGTSIAFTLATCCGHKWGRGAIAYASVADGTVTLVGTEGQQPEWR
jgi:dipeptidyl aminopeptidase/acylaminoacyl peptidase